MLTIRRPALGETARGSNSIKLNLRPSTGPGLAKRFKRNMRARRKPSRGGTENRAFGSVMKLTGSREEGGACRRTRRNIGS